MDELDAAIETILDQTSANPAPTQKLALTFRLTTDKDEALLELETSAALPLLDGKYLLAEAEGQLSGIMQSHDRRIQVLFQDLVERIWEKANLREVPDAEFPPEQRRPAPNSSDWNAPVSEPGFVPGGLIPLCGVHSRALERPTELRR